MKKAFRVMLSFVFAGALAFGLFGCGKSDDATDTKTDTTSTDSSNTATVDVPEEQEASQTFIDGVLTTPKMKIEITDYKVIPVGEAGNEYGDRPVIAFWYKVTNLTDADLAPSTAWIFNITAYQDNNPNAENKLDVGLLPDSNFSSTQMENIKKDGTVENAVAYYLDDTTTEVKLVASSDLGMTEIGTMTYKLS
jgi:PBP1b-binding outer membrane lipoprotein LpoB